MCGSLFDNATAVHEYDLIGEAPRLSEVVAHQDDLGAALFGGLDDVFDGGGRSRIEVGCRFIQKKDGRFRRECARECQSLLFAAGKGFCRLARTVREIDRGERQSSTLGRLRAAELKRKIDIRGDRTAKHHRSLEDHGLAAPDGIVH